MKKETSEFTKRDKILIGLWFGAVIILLVVILLLSYNSVSV